jgi:hypothetical protein
MRAAIMQANDLWGQGKINDAGVGGAFMLSQLSISVINEKLQHQ